MYFKPSGA